jgi:RimJ/RimL family protein N-acetyltransferase
MPIQTARLLLVPQTRDEVRDMLESLSPEQRKEVSPDWLARLESASEPDAWLLGFRLVAPSNGQALGTAGFKGPPSVEGVVEIAYGIAPEHEGQGYGTEAAEALTKYAIASGEVRLVRAHTMPETNASTRILTKNGFAFVGEVIDPEDGRVWRWEREIGAQGAAVAGGDDAQRIDGGSTAV